MGPYNGIVWRDAHLFGQVDLYLTGALPAPVHSRFEAHLFHCGACRTAADLHSEIAVRVASLPAQTVADLEQIPPDRPGGPGTGTRGPRHHAHWLIGRHRGRTAP
ncbi:zf-HC2 domain-containing protein [Dactylosporangium sp. NPDC048998]|uniref:zf-HC2 domain-containing protein n=1 Tax=Dactylosporangium sp. NPDC048998 TaxID=3363976 RepID=UPI00371CABDD